jgi:hypothetical protein
MRLDRLTVAIALFACILGAQQPNSANALMTIDANDGPNYPMNINVRTSQAANFHLAGGTNAPFVIVGSGNGNLQAGSATYWDDHYDLPLSPTYVVCCNGLVSPMWKTNGSGICDFQVMCPPVGTPPSGVPLGFHAAYQAGMLDYFSPWGWSLTAATRITTIQGPIVVNMTTGIGTYGDSGQATVNLTTYGMSFPFYGVNQSVVHISGDGYMTFGGSQLPDYTATDYEMNGGPPRIAGFWTDLDQVSGQIVRYTLDQTPPAGIPPFLFVEFINVMDAVAGYNHNFTWRIDTQGLVTINHQATNNPSVYDVMVGITPGNNLNPQTQKNLSAMLSPSFHQGAVNEGFWEWFGIVTQNPYYTYTVDDPYDLAARLLTFLPNGSGTLPASTNRYALYF